MHIYSFPSSCNSCFQLQTPLRTTQPNSISPLWFTPEIPYNITIPRAGTASKFTLKSLIATILSFVLNLSSNLSHFPKLYFLSLLHSHLLGDMHWHPPNPSSLQRSIKHPRINFELISFSPQHNCQSHFKGITTSSHALYALARSPTLFFSI